MLPPRQESGQYSILRIFPTGIFSSALRYYSAAEFQFSSWKLLILLYIIIFYLASVSQRFTEKLIYADITGNHFEKFKFQCKTFKNFRRGDAVVNLKIQNRARKTVYSGFNIFTL